jgi:hypothetical protein
MRGQLQSPTASILIGKDPRFGEFYKQRRPDRGRLHAAHLLHPPAGSALPALPPLHLSGLAPTTSGAWPTARAGGSSIVGGEPGRRRDGGRERMRANYPTGAVIGSPQRLFRRHSPVRPTMTLRSRPRSPTSSANALLVGMGMPRQESLAAENHADLAPDPRHLHGRRGLRLRGRRPARRAPLDRTPGRRMAVPPAARPAAGCSRRYCVEPWSLVGPACRDVVRALGKRTVASDPRAAENARWEQMRARNEGVR